MRSPLVRSVHIPSLDGIRAFAAVLVFISHAGFEDLIPGGFGVTIFFFLSGYLITTLLRTEWENSGTISFRNFYLRRLYRIFPPAYIVLCIAILRTLTGNAPSEVTVAGAGAQFAFLTNYFVYFFGANHITPDTGAMWSLAVEEHFYLLFPLALGMMLKHWPYRRVAAALAIFCAVVLAWRCFLIFVMNVDHSYTYTATDTRLDSIAFGCIMGVWLNPQLDNQDGTGSRLLWSLLLTGGAAILLLTFLCRGAEFRETLRYSLQGIALFPIFFCAVRFNKWPVFRWLEWRPVRLIGLVSYSFYLFHQTALVLSARWFPQSLLITDVTGLAMTLLFSATIYYLVERHAATLRKRLHSAA